MKYFHFTNKNTCSNQTACQNIEKTQKKTPWSFCVFCFFDV